MHTEREALKIIYMCTSAGAGCMMREWVYMYMYMYMYIYTVQHVNELRSDLQIPVCFASIDAN